MLLPILLIIGGAALATMGVLRITRMALGSMPVAVAAAIAVAGVGVIAFGTVLSRLDDPAPAEHELALEPEPSAGGPQGLARTDITGRVRTVEGEPASGTKVTLSSDEGTDGPVESQTSADGSFRFDDQQIGGPYTLVASFDGADFTSPPVFVPSKRIEIKVAPTTKDDADLRVSAGSLALVGDEEGIQAIHVLTLENGSDEAFVGKLEMPLLPGATSLAPGTGLVRSRLSVEDGQLVSDLPVMPGKTQITYSYLAPVSTTGLKLDHAPSVSTERFEILASGDLSVRAADAKRSDDVTLGGKRYQRSVWTKVAEGESIEATVTSNAGSSLLPIGLTGAGVAVAIALVAMPLMRRRKPTP